MGFKSTNKVGRPSGPGSEVKNLPGYNSIVITGNWIDGNAIDIDLNDYVSQAVRQSWADNDITLFFDVDSSRRTTSTTIKGQLWPNNSGALAATYATVAGDGCQVYELNGSFRRSGTWNGVVSRIDDLTINTTVGGGCINLEGSFSIKISWMDN